MGKFVRKSDTNQEIVRAVERVTDSAPVNGEDLLRSPELKRQLREEKARLRTQPRRK